jgi:menaquinol-cytochrome c reductase iron-sulfur subunit
MAEMENDTGVPRRGWLQRLLAGGLATLAGLVPVGAGLTVFLDPLRRRGTSGGFVRVTSLSSVPPDGIPRRFVVLADQVNAWTRRTNVRVGAVFLRRADGKELRAFNVTCPHAGCSVEYAAARSGFLCPCHDSTFALDGSINGPSSPSRRGMDELEVQVRNESEIWVRFQNFRAGVREKEPA